jgi:Myb/SANT-like DNA-binding domain
MMLHQTLNDAHRFKKRERTQNWAYEEKKFLLELCRKDMHIIENKRLDSALTSLKNRAWKIIHQQFAMTFGTDRNCNRLKEQWRRMKGEWVAVSRLEEHLRTLEFLFFSLHTGRDAGLSTPDRSVRSRGGRQKAAWFVFLRNLGLYAGGKEGVQKRTDGRR